MYIGFLSIVTSTKQPYGKIFYHCGQVHGLGNLEFIPRVTHASEISPKVVTYVH